MKKMRILTSLALLLIPVALISNTIKEQKVTSKEKNEYKLIWSDEFNGTEVNRDYWSFETGATGWGNKELQNYTDGDNATVKDGMLYITAKKNNLTNKQNVGDYTSTRMRTKDKVEFLYGKVEMRAKLPKGVGLWAAFWLLGTEYPNVIWPYCGEIDIMEYVGFNKDVQIAAIHNGSSYGILENNCTVNMYKLNLKGMEDEFHIYGMFWDESSVKFYIDSVDNIYYTYKPTEYNEDTWPHYKPVFLVLNLAVGGTWGGKEGVDDSVFPAEYIVDYVRVYQK